MWAMGCGMRRDLLTLVLAAGIAAAGCGQMIGRGTQIGRLVRWNGQLYQLTVRLPRADLGKRLGSVPDGTVGEFDVYHIRRYVASSELAFVQANGTAVFEGFEEYSTSTRANTLHARVSGARFEVARGGSLWRTQDVGSHWSLTPTPLYGSVTLIGPRHAIAANWDPTTDAVLITNLFLGGQRRITAIALPRWTASPNYQPVPDVTTQNHSVWLHVNVFFAGMQQVTPKATLIYRSTNGTAWTRVSAPVG